MAHRPFQGLTVAYWGTIAAALVTGGIHLWLGVTLGKAGLMFSAVGFAIGIGAVVLGFKRPQMVKLGIPFTAGQIVLYIIAHFSEFPGIPTIELADKIAQAVLVVLLVRIQQQG